MTESRTIAPPWQPTFTTTFANAGYVAEMTDDIEELPDDQITPDTAEPLPADEPVKTDPVPNEDDATTAPDEPVEENAP